nr:hypothetical protein [Tanacetum cinerariifolium]
MAAHTKRMERFGKVIFKQREEINDRMAEMFGLHRELTTNRTPENVLIMKEARHPITKDVNSISLVRMEEEENGENNVQIDKSVMEPGKSDEEEPPKRFNMKNEVTRKAEDEPAKTTSPRHCHPRRNTTSTTPSTLSSFSRHHRDPHHLANIISVSTLSPPKPPHGLGALVPIIAIRGVGFRFNTNRGAFGLAVKNSKGRGLAAGALVDVVITRLGGVCFGLATVGHYNAD